MHACTGGGVAAGCRWGRGERTGVMRAGTCGLQRQPSRPSVSPGRQPRPRPEPCAQGPEVTGRHPPARPSAVSASCGPSHHGVCCGFVICERTGRSESGTAKGQLVLCLSGGVGGRGAAGKGNTVGAWGRQISAVLGVFPKNREVKLSVIK